MLCIIEILLDLLQKDVMVIVANFLRVEYGYDIEYDLNIEWK